MRRIEDPTPIQFLRPKPSFQDLSPLQCGCLTLLNSRLTRIWTLIKRFGVPYANHYTINLWGEGNRTPKSCYRFTCFQDKLVHSDHLQLILYCGIEPSWTVAFGFSVQRTITTYTTIPKLWPWRDLNPRLHQKVMYSTNWVTESYGASDWIWTNVYILISLDIIFQQMQKIIQYVNEHFKKFVIPMGLEPHRIIKLKNKKNPNFLRFGFLLFIYLKNNQYLFWHIK